MQFYVKTLCKYFFFFLISADATAQSNFFTSSSMQLIADAVHNEDFC